MEVLCFTVGAFQVNTYLLKDESTGQCVIIDTGESDDLLHNLQAISPRPDITTLLLTHGHIDHAGSLVSLQAEFDVTTYLPRLEQPLFDTLPEQGSWFGAPHMNRPCGRIDKLLDDGDKIEIGDSLLTFISTPGHTPGQGCYYDDQNIFVGDTLFKGSVGRTDLPMGDHVLMQESLKRLMTLPGELRVHSGHGPVTTLSHELMTNPFLQFLR